jgi:hypothetical protein
MYELLLQQSYAEWVVPLTIALMWVLSWQFFTLAHPIYEHNKLASDRQSAVFIAPTRSVERPTCIAAQIVKTVKRKECPDDPEGLHFSI